MFSPQTQDALAWNLPFESGASGCVLLNAQVYRELVYAARQWDALQAGPVNHGANVALVPQADGSLRIEPR